MAGQGGQARLAGHNGGVHSEGVKGYIWPCLLAAYSCPALFSFLSLFLCLFLSLSLFFRFLCFNHSFPCHITLVSLFPLSLQTQITNTPNTLISISLSLPQNQIETNPNPIQFTRVLVPRPFSLFLSFPSYFLFLVRMVSEKIVIPAGSAAAAE